MIEGLVTRILEKYLIDYLENFDKTQLNISLLRGKIVLENLVLNEKLLRGIYLPLKFKYGRIRKIEINLPSLL
jgi:vacuolar protein sorting-associated protein 13A/C